MRLHLEEAAQDEHELLLGLARDLDAHRAGLDLREQRRVPRIDAELARDAGKDDDLRLAGEDLLFGADDVDVDRGAIVVAYWSVFAFSKASSIVPTM